MEFLPSDGEDRYRDAPDSPQLRDKFALGFLKGIRDYFTLTESGTLEPPSRIRATTNPTFARFLESYYGFDIEDIGHTVIIDGHYDAVRARVFSDETKMAEYKLEKRIREPRPERQTEITYSETAKRFGIALSPEAEAELERLTHGTVSSTKECNLIFNHPCGITAGMSKYELNTMNVHFTPMDNEGEYNYPPDKTELRMRFAHDLLVGLQQVCLLTEAGDLPKPEKLEGITNKHMAIFSKRLGFKISELPKSPSKEEPEFFVSANYETVRDHALSEKTTQTIKWLESWIEKNTKPEIPEGASIKEVAEFYGEALTDKEVADLTALAREAKNTIIPKTDYEFDHPSGLYISKPTGSQDVALYYDSHELEQPKSAVSKLLFARNLIRSLRAYFLLTESELLEKPSLIIGDKCRPDLAWLAIDQYGFSLIRRGIGSKGEARITISGRYEVVRDKVLSENAREAEGLLNEGLRQYGHGG